MKTLRIIALILMLMYELFLGICLIIATIRNIKEKDKEDE